MDGGARHPKRAKDGLTMTIDELLKIAQENIGYARLTNTMDQAERGICAAIAQAAAQTAQAMILRNSTASYDDPSAAIKVDTGN
jgi:hypothetical protein